MFLAACNVFDRSGCLHTWWGGNLELLRRERLARIHMTCGHTILFSFFGITLMVVVVCNIVLKDPTLHMSKVFYIHSQSLHVLSLPGFFMKQLWWLPHQEKHLWSNGESLSVIDVFKGPDGFMADMWKEERWDAMDRGWVEPMSRRWKLWFLVYKCLFLIVFVTWFWRGASSFTALVIKIDVIQSFYLSFCIVFMLCDFCSCVAPLTLFTTENLWILVWNTELEAALYTFYLHTPIFIYVYLC